MNISNTNKANNENTLNELFRYDGVLTLAKQIKLLDKISFMMINNLTEEELNSRIDLLFKLRPKPGKAYSIYATPNGINTWSENLTVNDSVGLNGKIHKWCIEHYGLEFRGYGARFRK